MANLLELNRFLHVRRHGPQLPDFLKRWAGERRILPNINANASSWIRRRRLENFRRIALPNPT